MIQKIKEFFRKKIYRRYNISFSKSGEDIQLKQLLRSKKRGVYVDIGCWDPVKASNTYYFHLRGWKGICIDPNPNMKALFSQKRGTDIFINSAVGLSNEKLNYYMLEESYSSMNTLNYDFVIQHKLENKVIGKHEIEIIPLETILEANLNEDEEIDFLDVDVEGFDLEVLKSNNWERFRPKIVLIETENALEKDLQSEITLYLKDQGYELAGKSMINGNLGNLFFLDKK